jgi:hypothetical protein
MDDGHPAVECCPFMITSVKRGDDGQINIYAREVTRGQ